MADTKAIANRIKSVKDTRKITNAMYLISSTKLRKARKNLEKTHPFFDALRSEIGKIVCNTHIEESKYFADEAETYKKGTCGILVITADKGLAGAYNQNVIKEAVKLIEEHPKFKLFVTGEVGRHYFTSHNIPYEDEFDFVTHEPDLWMARNVGGHIMEHYEKGELSQIYIVYTDLKNAMSSEARAIRLLPFDTVHFSGDDIEKKEIHEYEYVPSPKDVLESLIPVYCTGIIYSTLVDSFCCEQNDRMMAMDSANQNADKLVDELTVQFNHLRQNGITQEITEISASVKATRK